jgi:hypothetical protein
MRTKRWRARGSSSTIKISIIVLSVVLYNCISF